MGKRARENVSFLGLSGKFILVGLIFLVLGDAINGKRNPTSASEKDLEIERKLKLINKPAVKSIQSEDRDIIDCVEIDKQPAFDHPLLKDHKIQMRPSCDGQDIKDAASPHSMVIQVWKKNGSCPEGTIPIRRVRKSDLRRSHSLQTFGMKNQHVPNISNIADNPNLADSVLITLGYRYSGASGYINVWNPFLENADEYTSAQFWLQSGPREASDSIETGWMVNPSIYGDARTRFFTSWTSSGKGCYDLICSGFVQVSKEVALGGVIEPLSSHWSQNEMRLAVAQDPGTSNWWLSFDDNRINVGYWPPSIFSSLSYAATSVVWGGEVYSKKLGNPHTRTGMGSGEFAGLRFGRSCFINKIRIRDNSMVWKYPEWASTYQSQYNCYDVFLDKEDTPDDPYLYFGGPGQNDKCP